MSIAAQKEKNFDYLTIQSDFPDYSEIFSFLEQIRNFQIPSETIFSSYTLSLSDLRNESIANQILN